MPTLPQAVITPPPTAPDLTLPPVLVITAEETDVYRDACDEYKNAGDEDQFTQEEVAQRFAGLTEQNACYWALYGFTVQDWLTVESQMVDIANYVEQLRAQIDYLTKLIEQRQKVMDEQMSVIKNLGHSSQTKSIGDEDDN